MKPDDSPTSPDDAWIESLLHDRPTDYIDDAGFAGRLVQTLPRRRRNRRRAWLLTGATIGGCVIAGLIAGPTAFDTMARLPKQVTAWIEFDPLIPAYLSVGMGLLVAAGSTWRTLVRHR